MVQQRSQISRFNALSKSNDANPFVQRQRADGGRKTGPERHGHSQQHQIMVGCARLSGSAMKAGMP